MINFSKLKVAVATVVTAITFSSIAVHAQSVTKNWSGLYFGGQIGHSSGDVDWALNGDAWWGVAAPASNRTSFSPEGFAGGLHFGYGLQTSNNFYWGVEASVNAGDLQESQASPAFPGLDTWTVEIDNFWDLSGRAGIVRDNFLLYAIGGISGANVQSVATPPIDSSQGHHIGYVVGVGADYMLANGITVGLQYKYYDFGSSNHPFNSACGVCSAGDGREIDLDLHVVSARISTHF